MKTKLLFFKLCLLIYVGISLWIGNPPGAHAQQQQLISGTVTDSLGNPLQGVTVAIVDATAVTTTDKEGRYQLQVAPNDVLSFSIIGFAKRLIPIGEQKVLNVTLLAADSELDEVVVTGYSAQRRRDITGSVSVVDIDALQSIPSGSAVQALQGQAAGVTIIGSGVPGGRENNVFIRGISSFGNTQPLVLVDGVEGNLNDINANDMESMQVLKDAGAAAIYGVRGANGVIFITTKKGKSGQLNVTYDAYYATQRPLSGNPFNLVNDSEDYAYLSQIAYPGSALFQNGLPDFLYRAPGGASGAAMAGAPEVDPSRYNLDASNPINNYLIQAVNKEGTNWFQEVFKPAPMHEHNLSVSGGTDKANYLLSLNYFDQQGTLLETFHKRYAARINSQFKIKDGIRIGENLYAYENENPGFLNQSEGSTMSQIYRMMPIIPVYDIMGNFGGTFAGPDLGNSANPVATQSRTVNNRNSALTLSGNVYAEVDFLKHFTARTSIGGSSTSNYNVLFYFNPYNNAEGYTGLNSLSETAGYNRNVIWTNTLNYQNRFGKHNLAVLAGTESNKYWGRNIEGGSSGFFSTDFEYLILGNGTSNIYNYSAADAYNLFSVFGRVDYSFDDKYLLAATMRRDGSSRFGTDNRYGLFPSFSVGWRLSQESFMQHIAWVNDLKIKASYGILGSQSNVSAENAFTLFGSSPRASYYDITGSNTSSAFGLYQTRIGNSGTGWEENIITNIGFDATILSNKVNIAFEYYKKSVNGLLFTLPLPATVGNAAAPVVNIGDIQNKGFDIAVNYRGNISSNLSFNIGTNITTYKNLVVNIPDPGYFDVFAARNGYLVRNQVGQPVSSFFGYDVIGLFNSDEEVSQSPTQAGAAPGTFKYRDVNDDGIISADDRTFIGDPNPDFTYGLNLGLNYKGFDFSTILYGSQGNDVLNKTKWYTHFFSGFRGGISNDLLNAWTPESTNTTIPKIDAVGSFSTSNVPNSFYVEDGSFLKVRSLILGYTVSRTLLERYGVGKLRLYLQAANPFTITNYSGLDPELIGSSEGFGIDHGNYPNTQRSFLLGLNISF